MGALVIFSSDVRPMADFYAAVLEMAPAKSPSDSANDIRLKNDDAEVLLHSIPARIAKTILIESPPEAREDSAIKPVFDVPSLAVALEQVSLKGGVVTTRAFDLDGLSRHDVLDPEGNVIQLRSPSSNS